MAGDVYWRCRTAIFGWVDGGADAQYRWCRKGLGLKKGFIPAKLKEIEAIESIAAQLPAGVEYLKHREWLLKVRSSIERDIEDEKWRLFHGRQ